MRLSDIYTEGKNRKKCYMEASSKKEKKEKKKNKEHTHTYSYHSNK